MSKNILLGVTGGIAAYKAADLASRLKKLGYDINVIMTENGARFVSPLTFRTLTGNPVVTDTFETPTEWKVGHVSLAEKADLVLIAPATADIIGKLAWGLADDMLTTTVMATTAPVLIAPAMNVNMYQNPIVQENIERLEDFGYVIIPPEEGYLACGANAVGRLADADTIMDYVLSRLDKADGEWQQLKLNDFAGKRIIVSAGPTVENIDPVRYISNRSSGKMGFAIAQAALERGADVTLVAGPVNLTCDERIHRIDVKTCAEMKESIEGAFGDCDIVIMAAAPADYRLEKEYTRKIKKHNEILSINLIKNDDILYGLGQKKEGKILVGFAAETNDLETYAREKMEKKNLDMIVANNVASPGAGFDTDTNIITIFKRGAEQGRAYEKMTKMQAADIILDTIKTL